MDILFLPYKASMWDSMDSVWQAASRDERCHTIVMPIPYADMNEDGSVRRWNCDIDKFPDYLPVVDWRSYDITQKRPAVIYIHNPYDASNRITMVEPFFFSSNLCKYTTMLVYIPYFACTGVWPYNHLNLPCYDYVDKIILQSPYYNVIGNGLYEADHAKLEEVMPKGKVAVLGSPKIDCMLKMNKRYNLPVEWKRKMGIYKVIFYNTTVSPLLIYGYRALDKMWQVYNTMKKNLDTTFIWRPHPLLESMLESHRSELLSGYKAWKEAVLHLENAIYDNTVDLERSVALCDAYIGEYSSVTQLFAVSGKPIFYNDMFVGEASDGVECNLVASAMIKKDNVIYFWAQFWNALCSMDLSTQNIRVLYKNQSHAFPYGSYGDILLVNNHLILTPCNAKAILDYDLQTGEATEIPLHNPLETNNFFYALVFEDKVIMTGFRYDGIVTYSPADKRIKYLLNTPKEILDKRSDAHDLIFGRPCIQNFTLYVPIINSNQVLAVNLTSNEYIIYTVGSSEAGYGFAVSYAGNIWLAPWLGGPLLVWNPPTGVFKVFDQFPKDFAFQNIPGIDETRFFKDAIACGHYLWLLPMRSNMVLRLDMDTGDIISIDMGMPLDVPQKKHYKQLQNVWCGMTDDNNVYIWTAADRKIHCLDNFSGQERFLFLPRISKDDADKIRHELSGDDFFEINSSGRIAAIYEDGISRTQQSFIEYVKSDRHDSKSQQEAFASITANADGTCGKKIHEYIMSELRGKINET